jgi:hypothetical protein
MDVAGITVNCGKASAPATNWLTIIVGGLQFLLSLLLTAYVFRKNYKQKADERQASWFHKVVVDKTIELTASYDDGERKFLSDGVEACKIILLDANLLPTQKTEALQSALGLFQDRLQSLRTSLTNLALIFDKELADKILSHTLTLDDLMSQWFLNMEMGIPNKQSPIELISDFHRDVLRSLRLFEFQDLPERKSA